MIKQSILCVEDAASPRHHQLEFPAAKTSGWTRDGWNDGSVEVPTKLWARYKNRVRFPCQTQLLSCLRKQNSL